MRAAHRQPAEMQLAMHTRQGARAPAICSLYQPGRCKPCIGVGSTFYTPCIAMHGGFV
jgi:hypothetical protein